MVLERAEKQNSQVWSKILLCKFQTSNVYAIVPLIYLTLYTGVFHYYRAVHFNRQRGSESKIIGSGASQ